MEEDSASSPSSWVTVRSPPEKDWWAPTGNVECQRTKKPTSTPLKVTFGGPATHWTDAIPIGNGRLGAAVWGGVASETIQLNEDTLWTGVPGNYTNPSAPEALDEVRKLVDNGQYSEATTEAVKLSGEQSAIYQLLGDILLDYNYSGLAYDEKTYRRELDLDTATATVRYKVGGVEYVREHFASNPDQAVVMKLSVSKPGSLSFTLSMDSKMDHRSYVDGKNRIVLEGSCPTFKSDNPKGVKFAGGLELRISGDRGAVSVLDGSKFKVEGCDWAVLLLVAASSFDGPFTAPADSKKDPTSGSRNALDSIKNLSYDDLRAHHLDDYQSLFHRVSLQLSKSSKSVLGDDEKAAAKNKGGQEEIVPTADRVKSFQTDEDPSLVELLFQYGRYLLISCSRRGTQVANLQGIWSKDIYPPWDGAQHLNINLQMNYWPALPCNLRECQEPLFDYISHLSVNGSKTAKVNYEANGWVAHQVTDIWAKTSPDRGEALWALWPMGGAWLCTHLWEHYTYTMDKEFLKNKAYPLLEGCTLFLLDWLIEGRGGFLETNPSTSPEHMFVAPDGKQASVSYSSTMDMSIIKEVFSEIVSAAEILGKENDELITRVRAAQSRLLPTKVARDGSIMEWAEDFQDPEIQHRHLSHLFGLYPGHTITVDGTPDLAKAADNSIVKRGEQGPGWSTMWKASLWARLRNSEHAYRMIKHLFDLVDPDHEGNYEGGLYANLFTAHPPFQIDANFGFPAAIAEMLVQSTIKDLYLLPALPQDKWANGCAKGLKARGGLTVGISWQEGDLHELGLWSKQQHSLQIHYRGNVASAHISSGKIYTFNRQLKCIKSYSFLDVAYC